MEKTKNKNSFILYKDQEEMFDALTDEQAGKLIKAIFDFQHGLTPELDPTLSLVFIPIKQTLNRDADKWQAICERNIKNGRKGGRPKAKEENPENPVGYLGTQGNPKNLDSDSVSERDKYLTAEKKTDEETFEELLKPDAPIRYDWQYLALEIIEKLDVPENKRSAFFKACKENQARCQAALTYAVDFPNPKIRWNMFFAKYNELKNRKELNGEHR